MKRFLALILSLVMIVACLPADALAAVGETNPVAMHFLVRHWHAVNETTGEKLEDTTARSNAAVAVEGYITPNAAGAGYTIEARLNGGAYTDITASGLSGDLKAYIEDFNATDGTVKLRANPYAHRQVQTGVSVETEELAGYSISAGHTAANVVGADGADLEIKYDKNVHLVKSHAFYVANAEMRKVGKDLSGEGLQKDTRQEGDVKQYDTSRGLHTDKTASESAGYIYDEDGNLLEINPDEQGRTFDIDLEAWYSKGVGPQVAMVLDASGSMAFTVGTPEAIKITEGHELWNRRLAANANITTAEEWAKAFLTPAEVDLLLNKHNTDNSRLSSADYTYYVYDATGALEYAPLGYWDGGSVTGAGYDEIGRYPFDKQSETSSDTTFRTWMKNAVSADGEYAQQTKQLQITSSGDVVDFEPQQAKTGWGIDGIKMSEASGYTVTGSTKGILLDAVPSSKNFTLRFTVRQESDTAKDKDSASKPKELIYIGAIDGAAGNYLRVIRDGGSNQRLKVFQGDSQKVNINKAFNVTDNRVQVGSGSNAKYHEIHIITLSFQEQDDGKVTINGYLDDDQPDNSSTFTATDVDLDDVRIVLGGLQSGDYDGDTIYIDDVYLFNGTLTGAQAANYVNILNGNAGALQAKANEDAVRVPAVTTEGLTLGAIEQRYLKSTTEAQAGWYFVNPIKDWNANYDNSLYQSGKTLNGTPSQAYFVSNGYPNTVQVAAGSSLPTGGNDDSVYTPDVFTNDSVRFYIDSLGYLRCFYASAIDQKTTDENAAFGCSYVYESDDLSYIKTEALQRALGVFLSQLYERAPGSQVSATRFSTREDDLSDAAKGEDERKQLVLLQWTDKVAKSLGMLNLKYGMDQDEGGTQYPSGDGEYNYGLTGNTSTWVGLQSFYENLASKNPNAGGEKYLIVFTDGKDTDIEGKAEEYKTAARDVAKKLRDAGYTIFGVMLDGGPVEPGNDDFVKAWNFLRDDITDEPAYQEKHGDDKHLVYATTTERGDSKTEPEKLDALVEAFATDILNSIVDDLTDYNVQDYIDPRFDLVDEEGKTWYLNRGGNVKLENGQTVAPAGSEDGMPYWEITLTNSPEIEKAARTARLFYDKGSDMYFVRWTKQTIPNSPLNEGGDAVTSLNVWHGRITIRAKEDFIGGNAVLTNGNGAGQNYVYDPNPDHYNTDDPNDKPSSGVERSDYDGDNPVDSPSKGFPRTTVNVHAPATVANGEALIYLGEAVNNEEILAGLVEDAIRVARENGLMTEWYWEYMSRYDAVNGTNTIVTLLNQLGAEVELPYSYLPNADGTNTIGTAGQSGDVVGKLVYKLEAVMDDGNGGTITDNGEDHRETLNTRTRRARLTVQYVAVPAEDRPADNAALVIEQENGAPVYQWDQTYKKEQGTEVGEEEPLHYDAATYIVSGELVLEMVIPQAAQIHLQSVMPGATITYQAALYRTRPGSATKERVGTMTVSYAVPAKGAPVTGDATAYATLAIESAYDYAAAYGLPVGTYSLEPMPEGTTQSSLFAFSGLSAVKLEDAMAGLFKRYGTQHQETGDNAKALTALAATGGLTPMFGTDPALTHTDERYAMIRVTVLVDAGTLTVSKAITGAAAEPDRAFHFTVMLSDTSITGSFGGMTFNKGVAHFTLKGGESVTAEGLPVGARYSVTEQEANQDGYATTVTGASGAIGAEAATAVFVNAKDPEEVPVTGDNSRLGLWLAMLAMSMAGVIVIARRRRG